MPAPERRWCRSPLRGTAPRPQITRRRPERACISRANPANESMRADIDSRQLSSCHSMTEERAEIGERIGARRNVELELAAAIVPRRAHLIVGLQAGDIRGSVESHRKDFVAACEPDGRA